MAFMKPSDYDSAPSFDSDSLRLPAGGYLCTIKKIEEGKTPKGTPIIHVFFDISEGGFAGYYERLYKSNKANAKGDTEVRWKGVYDVFPLTPEGATSGAYKGLLTSIEKSNAYKINWSSSYDQFRGKKIGLLLREEEYISSYDGSKRTIVKACAARPYDVIRDGDYNIPQKKGLRASNPVSAPQQEFKPVDIDNDELPF